MVIFFNKLITAEKNEVKEITIKRTWNARNTIFAFIFIV